MECRFRPILSVDQVAGVERAAQERQLGRSLEEAGLLCHSACASHQTRYPEHSAPQKEVARAPGRGFWKARALSPNQLILDKEKIWHAVK